MIQTLLICCAVLLFATFFLTWWLAEKIQNVSIVDVTWAGSFFPLALLYSTALNGFAVRKVLLLTLVGLWSLRLAAYLYRRIQSHHPDEDSRYASLRKKWGNEASPRFLIFFMVQAVSVLLLSAPLFLIANNSSEIVNVWEILALLLWVVAWMGEISSDRQLHAFRSEKQNKGRVCRTGWWKYSRHPNYFFEWLIWCSYGLWASCAVGGWPGLFAPLLILVSLLFLTGIPPSEKQSLLSRGEDYRRYQASTSRFVPWFPRTKE